MAKCRTQFAVFSVLKKILQPEGHPPTRVIVNRLDWLTECVMLSKSARFFRTFRRDPYFY